MPGTQLALVSGASALRAELTLLTQEAQCGWSVNGEHGAKGGHELLNTAVSTGLIS